MKNNCCSEVKAAPKQGVCGGTFRFGFTLGSTLRPWREKSLSRSVLMRDGTGRMRGYQLGFTLIEILVVVLIIGILGAIMLPQYQKAVAKIRFASLKPIAKAVKDAQEIYYNREGSYTTTPTALDIQIPADAQVEMVNEDGHAFVRVTQDLLNNAYTVYLDHSENFAGNIYCEAHKDHPQAIEICESEGGKNPEKDGDYWYYLLAGNSTGAFSAPSILGDVDGDGQVTVDDVRLLASCIPNCDPNPTWDVNGDGRIDRADAQGILNLANGLNWDGSHR